MIYSKEYLYRYSISLAKSISRQDEDVDKKTRIFAKYCSNNGDEKERIENLAKAFKYISEYLEENFEWLSNLVVPADEVYMDIRSRDTVKEAYAEFIKQIHERYLIFCRFHPNIENDICAQALEYILTRPYERVDLAQAAENCFVNYSYLSHHFKKDMGRSFVEYVVELKLHMVRNMLRDSSESITYISKKVGYEDFKYLGRLFKKKYGITMSDYRVMNSVNKVS